MCILVSHNKCLKWTVFRIRKEWKRNEYKTHYRQLYYHYKLYKCSQDSFIMSKLHWGKNREVDYVAYSENNVNYDGVKTFLQTLRMCILLVFPHSTTTFSIEQYWESFVKMDGKQTSLNSYYKPQQLIHFFFICV